MNEEFIPKMNEFIELLKETSRLHAENITRLSAFQNELSTENERLTKAIKKQQLEMDDKGYKLSHLLEHQLKACAEFKEAVNESRAAFQHLINDTNQQLGKFSSYWGGYIETIGVFYMLNTLKKEYGVHTTFQKFKRWWNKSRNVEIDLLAISDTHAYIIEVKNQLKEETFKQMLTVLEKIKEKIPEYNHLKLQPVFICMHAEEKIVQTSTMGGIWVIRYKGFDPSDPKDEFEWLRKDE